ncbi:MAG TPA: FAD:protein FMN transferase, partial [Actinopolymorphaceae bacterium]|nr:FAD:protein FMN transferase [Actinopolymorphaceae bacterium]
PHQDRRLGWRVVARHQDATDRSATVVPEAGPGGPADVVETFRAMATDVTVRVVAPRRGAAAAVAQARAVFGRVDRTCTRFDPTSPLMRANAAGRRWHQVPQMCFDALVEASRAHGETGGLFDPRVLRMLQAWGYTRTLPFDSGDVRVDPARDPLGRTRLARHRPRRPWRPGLDPSGPAVRIGRHPVDLGGIGKGLAVRWSAARLSGSGAAYLVEAGGDCYLGGSGPDGDGWRVAVEDPRDGGADKPIAVLALSETACATSSVRVRSWKVAGRPVHHLVDPRSGRPGGSGLLAVTVVHDDPAWAEVWSKALFLAGRLRIRHLAEHQRLAALWVSEYGTLSTSRAIRPSVCWRASDG